MFCFDKVGPNRNWLDGSFSGCWEGNYTISFAPLANRTTCFPLDDNSQSVYVCK